MSCIHSCTTQMNVWIYNVFFLQSWPYVGKFAAAICALMRLNVCSGLVVVCVCDVRTVYCVSAANSNKNARLLSLHFTHFTLHFGSHAFYFQMANLLCVCARDSLIFVSTMLCQPISISSHRQFKSEPFFFFRFNISKQIHLKWARMNNICFECVSGEIRKKYEKKNECIILLTALKNLRLSYIVDWFLFFAVNLQREKNIQPILFESYFLWFDEIFFASNSFQLLV